MTESGSQLVKITANNVNNPNLQIAEFFIYTLLLFVFIILAGFTIVDLITLASASAANEAADSAAGDRHARVPGCLSVRSA
jgi:TRAP-type C4-dicarboxylate transport system permease small subunit